MGIAVAVVGLKDAVLVTVVNVEDEVLLLVVVDDTVEELDAEVVVVALL